MAEVSFAQVTAELGDILAMLAAQPAAAFFETGVARVATDWLRQRGVAIERDAYGNLLAQAGGNDGPPLVLVAHMDHPGAHLVGRDRARLMGGVAATALAGAVAVRVVGPRGERRGRLVDFDAAKRTFRYEGESPGRGPAFAVWDLPDLLRDNERWTMRAADDLMGVTAILWLLSQVARRRTGRPVIGALTRAEEVGLFGATLLAQSQRLPADALVISLEASRELPGARIGEGPVVRVGDRTSAFSPSAEALLSAAAARLAKRQPEFRYQRQLMSGGTCEATAFTAFGYETGALAVPLGNYHNVDPDGLLAAEYVSPRDLTNLALLLRELPRPIPDPQAPIRDRLTRRANAAAARLEATAAAFTPPRGRIR
jgi:putative aminopeptidase FrvX